MVALAFFIGIILGGGFIIFVSVDKETKAYSKGWKDCQKHYQK
jgi:hypothetical protein